VVLYEQLGVPAPMHCGRGPRGRLRPSASLLIMSKPDSAVMCPTMDEEMNRVEVDRSGALHSAPGAPAALCH